MAISSTRDSRVFFRSSSWIGENIVSSFELRVSEAELRQDSEFRRQKPVGKAEVETKSECRSQNTNEKQRLVILGSRHGPSVLLDRTERSE